MEHVNTPPSDLPESTVLSVERDGHVAVLWLDRAEKRNAMGTELWVDLPVIMDALGADPDVRAIVIAARGPAFSVGLDLMEFGPKLLGNPPQNATDRAALLHQIKVMQDTFTSIARNPKPVVAAVHGYCLGAGVDLITAGDIRVAADDSIFSVRETRIAMVADVGTLQRLPHIIDPGRVAEVVFTGKDFPASEAHEMGLVTHVYPDAESTHKGARELAQTIAANSPLAVQGAKQVLRATEGKSVDDALDYVALWNTSFLHSADLMEAATAFLEKRDPEFKGE
ncbi:MAG: crotonase/enoyl-CoA hydratase family protein [Acidimicrobiia bacterium]|nr:crotonase/enoyl-CoA hydratase family protein [Acidimicrobiia bacterium]